MLLSLISLTWLLSSHAAPAADSPIVCEEPSLPPGAFHIIIAGHEARTCFTHYLWHLGLSNAKVFVYRRRVPEHPLAVWRGPCGIEVQVETDVEVFV